MNTQEDAERYLVSMIATLRNTAPAGREDVLDSLYNRIDEKLVVGDLLWVDSLLYRAASTPELPDEIRRTLLASTRQNRRDLSSNRAALKNYAARAAEPKAWTFPLELSKDELTILKYVFGSLESYGEPLKDTYELCDDEPDDPEVVLRALDAKIRGLRWPSTSGSPSAPREEP